MIKNILNSTRVELIKIRSTPAFKIALMAPLSVVLIYSFVLVYYQKRFLSNPIDTWEFYSTIIWNFWSSLAFLPLIGIQTALVNDIEHSNQGWRNIFSLPIPKWVIYISKLLTMILLLLISQIALSIWTVIGGYTLQFLWPSLGFQKYALSFLLFSRPLVSLAGALTIIAIHNFMSTYFRNMFVSVGYSVVFAIATMFIIQNENINVFVPWCWPALATNVKSAMVLYFSLGGFLIVSFANTFYHSRKNVLA